MVADITDAVVGVDTHRDTHSLQIASAGGVPIAQCTVDNDDAGFAEAISWAVQQDFPWSRSCVQPETTAAAAKARPTPSTRTWRS